MKYFKQKQKFSCGPACAGMMLSALKIETTEEELVPIMECAAHKGTYRENWIKLETRFPIVVMIKAPGTLSELNVLKAESWQLSLLITSEVPHYVYFEKFAEGTVTYHDPWDGPDITVEDTLFFDTWKVGSQWPNYQSDQWFVGIKRR